jgi:hypothetical protein
MWEAWWRTNKKAKKTAFFAGFNSQVRKLLSNIRLKIVRTFMVVQISNKNHGNCFDHLLQNSSKQLRGFLENSLVPLGGFQLGWEFWILNPVSRIFFLAVEIFGSKILNHWMFCTADRWPLDFTWTQTDISPPSSRPTTQVELHVPYVTHKSKMSCIFVYTCVANRTFFIFSIFSDFTGILE